MNTPEDYILDAIEQVLGWELPDDEIADAANAQTYLQSWHIHLSPLPLVTRNTVDCYFLQYLRLLV